MSKYLELFFSKVQCSFRKGFSAQHYFLSKLEKWKPAVNNQKRFEALLAELTKALYYLSHYLLTAKLDAYGFGIDPLRLVLNSVLIH